MENHVIQGLVVCSILKLYSTYSQGQNGLNFTLFFPLRLQLSHHNCNILAGALHNCTKKVKTQTAMNGSNHVLYRRIKNYLILSQFILSTNFSKTEKSNILYKYKIHDYLLFCFQQVIWAKDILLVGLVLGMAHLWHTVVGVQYLLSQSWSLKYENFTVSSG